MNTSMPLTPIKYMLARGFNYGQGNLWLIIGRPLCPECVDYP